MAFKHPTTTQLVGEMMNFRPREALDATDELKRLDWLDDQLYPIVQEGLRIMNLPPDFRTHARQREYFKALGQVVAEWEKLRR